MTNIFHFGLPQCILLLVRSQIASDLAKLNSIPLNRARGPLNDNSNRLYGKAPQKDQACCALRTILSLQSLKHLTTKSLNVSPSGMLSNFVRATIATESNVIFCKFDIRIFHCPHARLIDLRPFSLHALRALSDS